MYRKSRNNLLRKIQIKEFNKINNIYKRFSSNEKVNWLIVSIWKREILLKSLDSILMPLSISGSSYDRLIVLHALTVQKANYKFFNESIYIKNYSIEDKHRKKVS